MFYCFFPPQEYLLLSFMMTFVLLNVLWNFIYFTHYMPMISRESWQSFFFNYEKHIVHI